MQSDPNKTLIRTTPEIFRETWKLQFRIMNRRKVRRVLTGAIIAGVVLVTYIVLFQQLQGNYFIFLTGVAALVTLRESIGLGAYLFDRAHHHGWIKENVEEETSREVYFTYDETGFALYSEDYDIVYRWSTFGGYFEEGGYLWILNQKFEMSSVFSEAEIPEHWERLRELVKANVEEVEPGKMKP